LLLAAPLAFEPTPFAVLLLPAPLELALFPVEVLALPSPLALDALPKVLLKPVVPCACEFAPKALLELLSPLALALSPVAVLMLDPPLALAMLPVAVLALLTPLALALVPQATLPPLPAADAPAPLAVPGGTAAPVVLPMQTNCAAAGVDVRSAAPSAKALDAVRSPARVLLRKRALCIAPTVCEVDSSGVRLQHAITQQN
jgi:hypothetical protein